MAAGSGLGTRLIVSFPAQLPPSIFCGREKFSAAILLAEVAGWNETTCNTALACVVELGFRNAGSRARSCDGPNGREIVLTECRPF